MVKRKVKVPNIVRGGIAIPLGNNYYFMRGRKHINGGIDIGSNPRTGIEVEDGEIMKMEYGGAKIFSSVPFLNGKSPAQRVMQGENPNDVFKRQESFKDRNNINNDGTTKFTIGGTLPSNLIQESDATYVNGVSRINERNRNIPYGASQVNHSPLAIVDIINDKTDMNKDGHLITGIAPTPSLIKSPLTLKHIRNGVRPLSSLPSNKVYRYTNMREVKDAKNVGYYRKMPNNITLPSKKVGRFNLGKTKGNDHGGKHASKGQPWTANISAGVGEETYIIATPGRRTRWQTGHGGRYSSPKKFNTIPKGTGLFSKFDKNGNTPISTKNMQVYKLNKNTKRVRLLKPTQYKIGGQAKWHSSNKVRSRIAKMEGYSMKTNRSFDLEDRDFYNAIPKEVRRSLSQDALDNLYSYSYNVGAGNFKKRVVPSLINLSRGKATVNDVAKSMWASKDSKLKGLRNRRKIEREGFINAYNKNKFNKNITPEPIVATKDNTTVIKPVVTTPQTPMIDLQQRIADKNNQAKEEYANEYNQYVINKGMELMQPKKRYNSTFALGGRINPSTGDYSRKKYGFGDEVLSRTKKLAKNMFGFTSDNAVVEVTDSKGRKRNISLGQYRNERAARANAPARTTKEKMSRAIAPKFRESEVSYNPFTNKYSYDESKEGLTTGIAPSAGFRRGAKIIAKAGKTLRDVRAARAAKAASQAANRAKNTTSAARVTTTTRTATNAKPLTPKEHATAIIKGMSSRRNSYPGINSKNITPKGMQPKLNPIATTGNKATIDRAIAAGRSQARHAQQAAAMRARRTAFDKSVEGAASSVGKAMRRVNQARKAGKVIKYGAIPATALGVGSYFAFNGSNNNNNDNTAQPLSDAAKINISKNNTNINEPANDNTSDVSKNSNVINTGKRRTNRNTINKGKEPAAFKNSRLMTEPLARVNPSDFTKDKKSYDALRKELAADYAKNKVAEQITKLKDDATKYGAFARKQAQTKFSTNDWIGLGSNAIGSLASALINDRMLKKFKYPEAPVQMTAAKLKTNYNINPQLDAIREQNYNFDSSVDNNTGSSQVALARKQRNRLNRLAATNELYAQKENYENEMINRDRLNQQGVTNQNIQAYNAWKQGKTAFENNIAEERSENYIAGLQNLNSGVQDMLSRQEQRKHDNNTIKAMLAANPNVKPELFNYYGLNLYRFGGCKRNK